MADGESARLEADWAARRRETALRWRRGYAERVRAGRGDHAPDGAMENDARVYTDPERYARELETVFREQPLVACLSVDLPEPGAMRTFDALGVSVLLTRDADGAARAFLNMCTHRGARLVEAPCRRKLITCPFHGWSFDASGKLIATPEPEAFGNIDKESRGLVPVPLAEAHGLVFIKPRAGDDPIAIDDHLGPFAPELAQLELATSEPVKSGFLEAECNWKYALDTYGEGYHFPTLHKGTVALIALTHSQYERFGRHHRIGWASADTPQWADKPETEWPEPVFGGVHYLFPNTVIFYGTVGDTEPFIQVFRHFPTGLGAMRTEFAVYAPGGVKNDAHREFVASAGYDGTAHVVDTEDYWIARNGWARLVSAPPGFKVVYGANELALHDQHRALAEATGMPLDVYG